MPITILGTAKQLAEVNLLNKPSTIFPAARADQISPHDLFAAAALAGVLSDPKRKLDFPSIAHLCFEIADEMMREREEYGEQN